MASGGRFQVNNIKDMSYKKICYFYFCVTLIFLLFFAIRGTRLSGDATLGGDDKRNWDDIVREINKIKNGDSKAAYDLGVYYQFVEKDFTAAYFWMVQAQKMNYKHARQDVVDSIEISVFSVASRADEKIDGKERSEEEAETTEVPYK